MELKQQVTDADLLQTIGRLTVQLQMAEHNMKTIIVEFNKLRKEYDLLKSANQDVRKGDDTA